MLCELFEQSLGRGVSVGVPQVFLLIPPDTSMQCMEHMVVVYSYYHKSWQNEKEGLKNSKNKTF